MGATAARTYAPATMRRQSREDGQMLPLLIFALLAAMWLGIAVFNVGRAAVLRSETQTAADAAAQATLYCAIRDWS